MPINVLLVGVGKIARDQHIPVMAKDPRFRLVGVVSTSGAKVAGVPTFASQAQAFAALPGIDAVANCTPPGPRRASAAEALAAGKHVLLEKPPAATISELRDLERRAAASGRSLMTAWHAQHNESLERARTLLAGKPLASLNIQWKENVRTWHPGQDWVWDAGNFGVFDPGVNALSALTKISPAPLFVKSATLDYPANRQTPVAATLHFTGGGAAEGAPLKAEFDWLQEGDHVWRIDIVAVGGPALTLTFMLGEGGVTKLAIDGVPAFQNESTEYERIYDRFAGLIAAGESLVDSAPLELVADAFLVGARRDVAAFAW